METNQIENCCGCECSKKIDRLLDQKEVAGILCVSVKTLEYWRWKGGGPKFVKVGHLARYRESDARMYVEQLG